MNVIHDKTKVISVRTVRWHVFCRLLLGGAFRIHLHAFENI